MRALFLLALIGLLAACGQAEQAAAPQNETARITGQIDRQAQQMSRQAENGAAAIEQAMENEGAAIFDNREALLNESGDATSATGNRSR